MTKLSRNILFNLSGQGFALVIGFVAVRLIYRELGDDEVGLIFFAMTGSAALAAALDLGLSSTIVREVAGRGQRDVAYIGNLLRTAGFVYWSSYLAMTAAILIAADPIATRWLNVRTMDAGTAASSLQILGCGLLLALPRSLYGSLLKGLQRMGTSNAIDAAATAIQQAGIIATVSLGGTMVHVSWWVALSSAAWLTVYLLVVLPIVPARALLPGWNRDAARANRQFTSTMAGVSLLALIHSHSDKLLASYLLPLGTFGLYAFGFSALSRGMILTSAVAQAALPSLANLQHAGDRPALLAQYERLQNFMCYATVVLFAAVPFLVPPVFTWLFGSVEAERMLLPSTLLAAGFYMNSTLNMPHVLSLAVGRPDIALSLNAYALIVVLPVTAVLVWRLGLVGAALSWVLYHVFAYAYAVPRVCRECADGAPARWYRNVAKFVIPAMVIYGAAWCAATMLTGPSAAGMVGWYAVGTGLYAVAGWRMLPTDTQRGLALILAGRHASQPGTS